jgi:hypothetical protein
LPPSGGNQVVGTGTSDNWAKKDARHSLWRVDCSPKLGKWYANSLILGTLSAFVRRYLGGCIPGVDGLCFWLDQHLLLGPTFSR